MWMQVSSLVSTLRVLKAGRVGLTVLFSPPVWSTYELTEAAGRVKKKTELRSSDDIVFLCLKLIASLSDNAYLATMSCLNHLSAGELDIFHMYVMKYSMPKFALNIITYIISLLLMHCARFIYSNIIFIIISCRGKLRKPVKSDDVGFSHCVTLMSVEHERKKKTLKYELWVWVWAFIKKTQKRHWIKII